MSEFTFLYGDEIGLNDKSELLIPVLFTSPYLLYDAVANLKSIQLGTLFHSEFISGFGWTVIDRYPVFRGRNLLVISNGFNEQFRLSFVPANTRSADVAFSLKIWRSDMPLSRSSSITVENPTSATATPSAVAADITAKTVLAANTSRKGATIWNASTATLYVELGETVSETDFAVSLAAGDYYEVPYGYTGLISGVWTAANGSALVRELI